MLTAPQLQYAGAKHPSNLHLLPPGFPELELGMPQWSFWTGVLLFCKAVLFVDPSGLILHFGGVPLPGIQSSLPPFHLGFLSLHPNKKKPNKLCTVLCFQCRGSHVCVCMVMNSPAPRTCWWCCVHSSGNAPGSSGQEPPFPAGPRTSRCSRSRRSTSTANGHTV